MFPTSFLAIVVLVAGVIVLFKTVRMVPQGFEWTVERFGRYTHTMTPGLHFLIPVVYGVGRKINMMEQVLDVPSQDVITKDNAVVRVDGVVFFQVLDAAKAAYEVSNLEIASVALVQTNIRTVIGSMDLDESLSQRETINAQLLSVVDQATNPWGIKVTRIEIRDIQPPRDLIDSMARQMKAEREKRAQILEAEGSRQSEILRAEGEKQAAVLEAEGRKEAAFRDAEARERLAEAEAKATQVVSDAIAQGSVQAINYFVAQKYVEAFKALATAPNQKFVLMPMESSGIIGSIAGIAELAKSLGQARRAGGARAATTAARGRLSDALGRGRLGSAGPAVDRRRDAGARRVSAVDGHRGRRSVRAGAGRARHVGTGADRGVRGAQLRRHPGVSHLVLRQGPAERSVLAQPAR